MREIQARIARLAAAVRADELLAAGDRQSRDAAIAEADAAGHGTREIAAWADMSPAAISGILGRAAAARQAAARQSPPVPQPA